MNAVLGEIDLSSCESGAGLSIKQMKRLSRVRQSNLLRSWIQRGGFVLPADKILQRVLDEVLDCVVDASPLVQWPGAEIRRYRDLIFVMPPLPEVPSFCPCEWRPGQSLQLDNPAGLLTATLGNGTGLHSRLQTQKFEIRFRRGGEAVQPASRGQTHSLKKLLQEKGIPAWERERLPLLYVDGQLVAVPDICICEGFQAESGQPGYFPHWSRLDAYL